MFLYILKSWPSPVRRSVPSTIINLSCELRSLLFANEPSVKMNSFALSSSSGTNVKPRWGLLICYWICTFRFLKSSASGVVVCAAVDRSNAASGWYTNAIYASLALYIMYCCAASLAAVLTVQR
jgi:hypothetical protein